MDPLKLADIQERLFYIEQQLEATRGHMKALELCLRLSIATHSKPAALIASLDLLKEGKDGEGTFAGGNFSPSYEQSFRQAIDAVIEETMTLYRRKSE